MATTDYGACENKLTEESPLKRALDHHQYTVRNLRATIASKQEELRIHLALLKTLKKLAKGGK